MRPWFLILLALVWMAVAATADDSADITVTGSPASAEFLHEVLARHRLDVADKLNNLQPGQQVTVSGCKLVNLPLPALPPAVLGFSDHPEKVADSGVLFWGGLLSWRPVRLQYYHEGAPGQPAHVLSLYVDNPTQSPVTLQVVSGVAGPCVNPIEAGHASGRAFLRRLVANEGEVLVLAPGENRELFRHALPPQQTVSGLVQMTLLTPGQVHYHVISRNSVDDPVSFPTVDNPADVHAKGAFMVTEVHAFKGYRAGAPDTYVSIGNHAPGNVLLGKALAGDYGITYDTTFSLRNAGDTPAHVGLYFQPRGGSATATFMVDKRMVDVGLTTAKTLKLLGTYTVPAHGQLVTHILTLPEGASSYPVRLLLRTLPASGVGQGPGPCTPATLLL